MNWGQASNLFAVLPPENFNQAMRHKLSDLRWVSLLLFGAVLFSYGIFIRWFGLYGDDWIYLWNYHQFGAGNFVQFVAADRPFSAWIYVLTSALFGEKVWLYHVLLLILRWISAILFWWILRIVWPEQTRQATWAAVLFAVYPGFRQQPIAVQFILHFSILDLFLFSVVMMLLAVKKPQKYWTLTIASILSALAIFSLEYFAGLELLRPVLLWLVVDKGIADWKHRLRLVLKGWLPSLIILIGFAIWRTVIFSFPTYGPSFLYQFQEFPTQAIKKLVVRIISDWKSVSYGAWRQVASLPEQRTDLLLYSAMVLVVFGLVFLFLKRQQQEESDQRESSSLKISEWPVSGLLVGIYALLAAGWPFWITLLPLDLAFPWDRATLPFMFGVSLLMVAGMDLVIRPRFQVLLVSALVGLAVGSHYQNAVVYREEWRELQNYFWQLTWRVPGLEPGTVIISDDIPLWRYSDNDLTPVLNWVYAPEQSSTQQEYKYFDLSTREESVLPGLEKDLAISHSYRNTTFKSSTSAILAVYYSPPDCLRVLGPEDFIAENPPYRLEEAQHLSDLSQIILSPHGSAEPPAVMGAEPDHGWCYAFEKADLARQSEDWERVVGLGDEAFSASLKASNPLEYLPFVEGYARLGEWDKALELSKEVQSVKLYRLDLCKTWSRIQEAVSSSEYETMISEFRMVLGCETSQTED